MNKLFIAAAVIAIPLSAGADGSTYDYPQGVSFDRTRAEVSAERDRAAANGESFSGELTYVAPPTGPALSRAQVTAELDAAREANQLFSGEQTYVAVNAAPQVLLAARPR
jgi:hypothetical protein